MENPCPSVHKPGGATSVSSEMSPLTGASGPSQASTPLRTLGKSGRKRVHRGLGEAGARLVPSQVDITTVIERDLIKRGDYAAYCYTEHDRSASTAGQNVFR